MFFKKPLKIFLFPAANILLALFLLRAFYLAGLNVTQSFLVAQSASMHYLEPRPMNYFYEFDLHGAPLNKNMVRFYKDYYENLVRVYPCLWDAYGLLGVCWYYLGDDLKAIDYLKKAIFYNPLYSWNYYNLGIIYFEQSRYQEASALFEKIQLMDPKSSINRIFLSKEIYLPLLEKGGKDALSETSHHLRQSYKVSFALDLAIHQMGYNKSVADAIKRMDFKLYAF